MALGLKAKALWINSYALGNKATTTRKDAFAIGHGIEDSGQYSMAIALNQSTRYYCNKS